MSTAANTKPCHTDFPDDASWLAARQTCIGASEVGALLGANRHRSAVAVYTTKVEGIKEDETSKMRAGLAFEEAIAKFWAGERDDMRLEPMPRRRMWAVPNTPFACTPDFIAEDIGGRYVIECKRVTPALAQVPTKQGGWKDGPPLHYLVQVQYQLMVLSKCGEDVTGGFLVADFGGDDVREYPIEPDPELWTMMESAVLQFWSRHILTKTPPQPDQFTDSEQMGRAWNRCTSGKSVEIPAQLAVNWRERQQALKIAEDAADQAKVALQAVMQDAEFGTVNGATVISWKNQVAHHEAKPARDVKSRPFKGTKSLATL
jgi:predicted phage-related endonuclease